MVDRFEQIKPRIIFSVEWVVYNGKIYDHSSKLSHVVSAIGSIEKVIIIPFDPDSPDRPQIADAPPLDIPNKFARSLTHINNCFLLK